MNDDLKKNYTEKSDEGHFLEFDVHYLEKSHELQHDLVKNLVANLHYKTECVIHIRNFSTGIKSWISFENVHRVISFNQNAWLKPYIDMNTDLRKRQKIIVRKIFLS